MKGKLVVLILALLVLILSGFSKTPLECQVFDVKFMAREKNWTDRRDKYYLVDSYEEYKSLLGTKVFLYNQDLFRFNKKFFEENMIVFVRVDTTQGIKDVNAQTYLRGSDLHILIGVGTDCTMVFDSRAIGIIIKKTLVKKVLLEFKGQLVINSKYEFVNYNRSQLCSGFYFKK